MEQLLKNTLEKAKTNKKGLKALKHASVVLQDFEFAAKLREIETANFPESNEEKAAKKIGSEIRLALGMVELKVDESVCYKIYETLRLYNKMKGKFSIKEASKIIADTREIFNED